MDGNRTAGTMRASATAGTRECNSRSPAAPHASVAGTSGNRSRRREVSRSLQSRKARTANEDAAQRADQPAQPSVCLDATNRRRCRIERAGTAYLRTTRSFPCQGGIRGILFPVEDDDIFTFADQAELLSSEFLDVGGIGPQFLDLLPELPVLVAQPAILLEDLLVGPVKLPGPDDAGLSEEGKEQEQDGDASREQQGKSRFPAGSRFEPHPVNFLPPGFAP